MPDELITSQYFTSFPINSLKDGQMLITSQENSKNLQLLTKPNKREKNADLNKPNETNAS